MADIDFARLLSQEGRFEEAEALFRATLPELARADGVDPRLVSIARAQMAVTLGELGRKPLDSCVVGAGTAPNHEQRGASPKGGDDEKGDQE